MTLPHLAPDAVAQLPAGVTAWLARESVSTMDDARRMAFDGAPDLTLVRALQQTGGRGRLRRVWQSPPGNLYLSLLIRRMRLPVHQVGFVAGVALAEATADLPGLAGDIRLKWPNDVLLDGAKVAGLLLETGSGPKTVPPWCVIGLGLNVVRFPHDLPYPATCLAAAGYAGSAEDCVAAFLQSFVAWRQVWLDQGFAVVRSAWLARAAHLGQPIQVQTACGVLAGTFTGLDGDGALQMETSAGCRSLTTGDVVPPISGKAA